MKKINFKMLLTIFVIILFANNLSAQGAYFNINAGYGFSMSSQSLYSNSISSNNSKTHEIVNVSLGRGFNAGAAFGYMFNPNIGAELGVSYLFGGESTSRDVNTNHVTDYTISSRMLRIIPSIVIASGFEGINPYAKFGLVIGSGSIMDEYHDNHEGNITVINSKLSGGTALGLSSAIGVLFNLNERMSLFGELNMVNLSYGPTHGEVITATYNGADVLPNMKTKDRETEYVDSYTTISGSSTPDSEPDRALRQMLPFGSFGFNFGLRIGF
ncbi:MAG: porin family protein [Saprospiraceae bacterium]|nr:porin family protein [Saprospiraceae bacterium]